MKMDYGVCPQPQQTTASHGDMEKEINHKANSGSLPGNWEATGHTTNQEYIYRRLLMASRDKLLRNLNEVDAALQDLEDPTIKKLMNIITVASK